MSEILVEQLEERVYELKRQKSHLRTQLQESEFEVERLKVFKALAHKLASTRHTDEEAIMAAKQAIADYEHY